MRPRDRGSAIVEFVVLGSLVFGVLVEAVVLFGSLHRATLATSAAAREYGRAVVIADSEQGAVWHGAAVVAQAARNHGLPAGTLSATVEGGRRRGDVLIVRVRTSVPIAQLPFVGAVWPSFSVPVEASHAVQVDRYRGFG
ncbi:MAG: hypothetical protein EXQ69_00760 [Acidimicrobiia bacterium]|nr:hypothetical protein [Acidimicrobiia bacterium]